MRKTLCFLVLFVFLLSLVGCSTPSSEEARRYDIIQEDGAYYLLLHPPVPLRPNHTIDPRPEIVFSSINELRWDILTQNFSEKEWTMLYYFARASLDRSEQKIPIFDHIYRPILPDSTNIDEISWYGKRYSVSIECEEASNVQFNPFLTEQGYQEELDYYQNFNTASNYNITSTSFDPERSATVYQYSVGSMEQRLVYYSATNNGIEYHIAETYGSPESTVPADIRIYANDNGLCFSIYMSNLTLRPSVEWLTSFGIVEEPPLNTTEQIQ